MEFSKRGALPSHFEEWNAVLSLLPPHRLLAQSKKYKNMLGAILAGSAFFLFDQRAHAEQVRGLAPLVATERGGGGGRRWQASVCCPLHPPSTA